MWLVQLTLLLAAVIYFGSAAHDWATDRITAYPAMCSGGKPILPRQAVWRRTQSVEATTTALKNAYRDCSIDPLSTTTYVLNRARAEVIYDQPLASPGKLVNCTILDRKNWSCEYEDYASGVYQNTPYSGTVAFKDGRPTINEQEVAIFPQFYMRRWQWWAANVLGMFMHPVQSRWLIPEQQEHF